MVLGWYNGEERNGKEEGGKEMGERRQRRGKRGRSSVHPVTARLYA